LCGVSASGGIRGVPFGGRDPIAENTNGAVSFQQFERRRERPWHSRCPCWPAAREQHERVAIFRTVGERARGAQEVVMGFQDRLRQFARNTEGQDLLEYALLVGLIALVAVVAITSAGSSVNTIFTNIAAELAKAA